MRSIELYNRFMEKLLKENEVEHYFTLACVGKSEYAEKSTRKLKMKIYKYVIWIYHYDYINNLQDIVHQYYNTFLFTII